MKRNVLWVLGLFLAIFSGCLWKHPKAELVLTEGIFYTSNPLKPQVEMVAIRNGRILAVGKSKEAKRYIGEHTRVIKLQGAFGCAGFNDAHLHVLEGGQTKEEVDLTGASSPLEIQKRILEKAWKIPWGSWIIGYGWDQTLFPDKKWPTKKIIDDIIQDFPVYLVRFCGNVVLVNSKVLTIAGITANTPNPPGGEIVRDPVTGEPTGILKGEAVHLVSQYMPDLPDEKKYEAIRFALSEAKRFGITTVQDETPSDVLPVYKKLFEQGELTCRISVSYPFPVSMTHASLRKMFHSPMLCLGPIKDRLDGTLGGNTACFSHSETNDPEPFGLIRISPKTLNAQVMHADGQGFQISLHAVGDRAVSMALDAFELAQKTNTPRESRHRIEEMVAIDSQSLSRFKNLGLVACMQPAGLLSCIRMEHEIDHPSLYPFKTLLNHGIKLAFGSDWPWGVLNPLWGIYAAVTRQDTAGNPSGGWIPSERLSVREAIDAYTIGSAYAEFMDHLKGSLEPGKLADIVILDRNLLEIPPKEILSARVLYTIVDGKIVYTAGQE